jgi:hypothetical protein
LKPIIWLWVIVTVLFLNTKDLFAFEENANVLLNATVDIKNVKKDSTFNFIYHFDKKIPLYFYEIRKTDGAIVLKFMNTEYGGFMERDTTMIINKGPLKTYVLHQELRNKNEDMEGLTPDYYYEISAVFECKPVLQSEAQLKFIERPNQLTLQILWPSNKFKRAEMYIMPKPVRKGLYFTLGGIGAAALGAASFLIWKLATNDNAENDELQPVLPVHPGK